MSLVRVMVWWCYSFRGWSVLCRLLGFVWDSVFGFG